MIAREMIAEKVFAESVAKDIRNFLPEKYENAEFQVMQMNKNNGVQMVGVQVRLQEENVCPVVYVGSFFNEIRLGEPVEKVMNEIAKCMEEAGNAPFVHNGINPMDYDSVKEHLAVMLVNTQANKRMLQEMPHENIEDLSAICYVDFPVESNDGKATMKVKNEHLKMWNVDAKEMEQCVEERKHLRYKIWADRPEEEIQEMKEQIKVLTEKIGMFRKEAVLCDGITARSKVIEEKFEMVREEKEKKEEQSHEHIRRSR